MPDERNKAARCGFALVVVLLIIMAIEVLAIGFLSRSDVELACGDNMILKTQMDYLAESALEHAKGLILNPQNVTSEYWTGATGQQLSAGSSDYYDVNVIKLGELDYQIISTAYRENGSERVGSSSLTETLRLNPCIVYWQSSNQNVPNSVVINGDAYFGGSVTNYGTINGDVYSAATITNYGQIQGQQYPNVSQAPCNTPGISDSNFSSQYYYNGLGPYSVESVSGTYGSTTPFPSPGADPGHVYYCASDLTIDGNVVVNGSLVVEHDLTLNGGNLTIQSVKNFPALIVGHDFVIQMANTAFTATGYVQVYHHIDMGNESGSSINVCGALYIVSGDGLMNTNGCSLSVTGMPNQACLAIWPSESDLTMWSSTAGAFFKAIKRQ
jgi:hypothetical protein